jgi:hypothetical protein
MQQDRPPDDRPPEEQTAIGLPLAGPPGDAGTQVGLPLPATEGQLCEACQQPIEPGSLFCQACGAETTGREQPAPTTRQPVWFPLVMIGWLIVMVVALVLLYSFAIQVG